MPQDGLKSVIYRSFVTCDDPKGVVTCGTIRRSKTNSRKMEDKMREIGRRKAKSLSTSLDYYSPEAEKKIMASKGEIDSRSHSHSHSHSHSPASLQLMEVSRGAQKLNHVIDSWTKGVTFDGQSKDIATDLLKGALDLQDSLIMLGKLQEASQYMAHLKRKQIMESSGRRRYDDHNDHDHGDDDGEWIGKSIRSCQFRDKHPMTGFQNPRPSFDGSSSSRNSTEELKKVIKESLVSQNLLSKARKHERACFFAPRSLDSAPNSDQSPSTTSSSQSSLPRPATESPTAYSSSVAPQTAKGPNLIAKLMGLEEYPSKPLQGTPQKGFEGQGKVASERRPAFDIDMPKARKPQYVVHKADSERKTLKEILDTMQFKGLLRGNSAKGVQPFLDHPNASRFEQRLVDDGPPIVLIKPLRVPSIETKEMQTHRPLLEEEDPLYRRKMLRKLRSKEELQTKEISYKEVNLKSDKISRKSEAVGISSEELKWEGSKEQRVIVEVPEEKEVVVKENASVKSKDSHPVNQRQQRIEAVEKRADRIQKITTVNKRPLEKDVVKSRSVPKAKDQARKVSIKAGKPNSELSIGKSQNSFRQPSTKQSIIKHGEQSAASNSTSLKKNRTKKEKPGKKPTISKPVTETCGREEVEKKIEVTNGSEYHEVIIEIDPENCIVQDQLQLPEEEDADIYDSKIEERCTDGHSSLCDATPSTPCADPKIHSKTTEQAPKDINLCTSTDEKASISEASLRALLLSSLSFQNHVEELFDININSSSILQTSHMDTFEESSMRLSFDCAKELVGRKSLQDSQTARPLMPICAGKLRCCISLEILVEEVCRGIENLKNYSKLGGQSLAVDGLYAMLNTDLTCGGFVNGIWDSSWRTGFSSDEAEQVVSDIEKLVLKGLIEEVFS